MPLRIGGNKNTWLNRGLRGDFRGDAQRKAEERTSEYSSRIEEQLDKPPQYDYEYMDVPEEVYQAGDVYADTADELRGSAGDLRTKAGQIESEARGIAGQRLDYAREYTDYLSESDMPGLDIYQEGISQSTAGAYGAINQMGGQGGLGAVNQIYQSELGALRDLSVSNAQYKQNTRQNVYNTMSMAFGDYANTVLGGMQTGANIQGQAAQLTGQAGQMQATGLQNIAATEQDVFSFNTGLDQQGFMINEMQPYQNQMDYNMAQLGYNMQAGEAARQRSSQFWNSLMNSAVNLISAGAGSSPGGATPTGGGSGAGGAGGGASAGAGGGYGGGFMA